MAFKDANALYQGQDYRAAAAKYEEVLENDPNLTYAYFFLGNSYDQQYRSVKRGEPANDALLTKAIANYKKSAEVETDPKIKRLALDYLVSAYGPDKLNDPAQAEPILLNMIKMDPKETSSYFGLANIYEQSGDYERAEQMLTAGARRAAERCGGLHAARRLLQPPGRVRQDDGRAARAGQDGAVQPRGALHHRHLLLGEGVSRLHHPRARQAQVRAAGSRGGGRGDQAESELLRGAHLQEPAAAGAGQRSRRTRPASRRC